MSLRGKIKTHRQTIDEASGYAPTKAPVVPAQGVSKDIGGRIRQRSQMLERWGDKVDQPTLMKAEEGYQNREAAQKKPQARRKVQRGLRMY